MFANIDKRAKILAIAWLTIISILFFLPGSALPHAGWHKSLLFDKWVHLGFFALLVFLWRFYFAAEQKFHLILLGAAFVYGLLVELIQHYLIDNRSFDAFDVAADMAGAVIGILCWQWYKKK
jgi:hypothetical protein